MSSEPAREDIERRVERLAASLHARGYLVTRANDAEPAAIAELLDVSVKTLRNWRCDLQGPRARVFRGHVLYPLRDFIAWEDAENVRSGR